MTEDELNAELDRVIEAMISGAGRVQFPRRMEILRMIARNDIDPGELAAAGAFLLLVSSAKKCETMPDSLALLRAWFENCERPYLEILHACWDQLRHWPENPKS